eukprot:bmy_07637T0
MHIDDTDTLTRARVSGVDPPSLPGGSRRDGLEAGDIAAGRQTPRSRCHPGSGDVRVPQSQLRGSPAAWPEASLLLVLPSASCRAPRAAPCSASGSAPSPPQPPSARLQEACRPPALLQGSVTSGMHCPLIVNPIIVINERREREESPPSEGSRAGSLRGGKGLRGCDPARRARGPEAGLGTALTSERLNPAFRAFSPRASGPLPSKSAAVKRVVPHPARPRQTGRLRAGPRETGRALPDAQASASGLRLFISLCSELPGSSPRGNSRECQAWARRARAVWRRKKKKKKTYCQNFPEQIPVRMGFSIYHWIPYKGLNLPVELLDGPIYVKYFDLRNYILSQGGQPEGTQKSFCHANILVLTVTIGIKGRLNRLPAAGVGDMVMATVKKGKPELRKKVHPAVVIRQRKSYRRKDVARRQTVHFQTATVLVVDILSSATSGVVAHNYPVPFEVLRRMAICCWPSAAYFVVGERTGFILNHRTIRKMKGHSQEHHNRASCVISNYNISAKISNNDTIHAEATEAYRTLTTDEGDNVMEPVGSSGLPGGMELKVVVKKAREESIVQQISAAAKKLCLYCQESV